jgi:hypothetical protein
MLKGENRNDVDPGINLIDFGRPDDRPQIIWRLLNIYVTCKKNGTDRLKNEDASKMHSAYSYSTVNYIVNIVKRMAQTDWWMKMHQKCIQHTRTVHRNYIVNIAKSETFMRFSKNLTVPTLFRVTHT